MEFTTMSDADLTAALSAAREKATALFAIEPAEVTPAQADEAEALMASVGAIEAEQASRTAAKAEAAKKFAAAKAQFSTEPEAPVEEAPVEEAPAEEAPVEEAPVEEDPAEEDPAEEASIEVEAAKAPPFEKKDDEESTDNDNDDDKKKKKDEAVTTASARTKAASAREAAGSKNARPEKTVSPVTITAAADLPNITAGAPLDGLDAVSKALKARGRSFPSFNAERAQRVADRSGGAPVLTKVPVASFNLNFDADMVAAKKDDDYNAVKASREDHLAALTASLDRAAEGGDPTITAAGWCAPSPYVYNWIADFVVDGLLTLPEVSAPRGGLQITEGPQLAQTVYGGNNVDNFGFGGTEADMEAGYVKECETIVCPEFEDHRLDFTGYCFKIPFLTEHAYPELVSDALRLADVLYAHKMNRRFIRDIVALSSTIDATGQIGGSMLDTLEAFTQVATKERRWWNIGENAIMEVKLPQVAKEIFMFDMARRSGLALTDVATEQKVAAHFASKRLAVEYVSDWQDRHGQPSVTADWPDTLSGIMYPAGTFAKAVEDVVNLSGVHDAASLSANEYTGVFMEQGVMTVKLGYRSHVITVPVCTSGMSGANILTCDEVGSL